MSVASEKPVKGKGFLPYNRAQAGVDGSEIQRIRVRAAEVPHEIFHQLGRTPVEIVKIEADKPVDFAVSFKDGKRVVLCFTEKNLDIVLRFN